MVVGLGNPGPRYKQTLHNVGFKVTEKLAEKLKFSWKFEERFQANTARGEYLSTTFHLLRPETFMNLSGEAVREYLRYFRLNPSQMIVVADDADMSLCEIRLRSFGGSGGHNGLKSISHELLTNQYMRLKMGIGRPPVSQPMSLADYVLMPQPQAMWDLMEPSIDFAAGLLIRIANESFENVMKDANTRSQSASKVKNEELKASQKIEEGLKAPKMIDGEINETRTK